MTNKEIYKATLTFSLRRFLYDLVSFLVLGLLAVGGLVLGDRLFDQGLVGLGIGLVIGIIAVVIMSRYVSYTYKAGQIAMMTRAITEGNLPEDVVGEGKKVVKERFATVAIFFAATSVVRGIFTQIGRGMTRIGRAVGGDNGETVASVISAVIQVVVAYLCDCCLGWIFYRKDQSAPKATCEGAVLFFRHGKTFAKNMGRVFGMGLASFVAIGGVFTGIFYAIASQFPEFFAMVAESLTEVAQEEGEAAAFLSDPNMLTLIAAVAMAVILWSILHSVFVRPFVLTGVLRNYLQSGMEDIPSEASFAQLDGKSSKFAKLHGQLA